MSTPRSGPEDWMQACEDSSIKAIITSIGGDDGIRLLPYVDFEVLRRNPKVFLGYSDTTAHHLMMCCAGVVSFYGPAFMSDFAAYGSMPDYTVRAVRELLFEGKTEWLIEKCPYWEKGSIAWDKKNMCRQEERLPDPIGYEILQGEGSVQGRLMGGCIDAFPCIVGRRLGQVLKYGKRA